MRTPPPPLLIRVLAALTLGLALAGTAVAQGTALRTLPEDAKRGTLSHVRENVLNLDGRPIKLAPGAQIRGANNLIVQPTALPKDSLVKYQLNGSGELFRVWVLTAEETAMKDKSSPPSGVDTGRPFSEIVRPQAPPPPGRQSKP